MKKRCLGWMALGLLAAAVTAGAQTTTTYAGTVKDLTGATVTSGRITWTLNAPSGGTIPGTGLFVQTTVSCLINASGQPVASDGTSPCTVTNNTSLTPSGTSYKICIQAYYATPGACFNTFAIGGTVDISTLVPTPTTQPNYGSQGLISGQANGVVPLATGPSILAAQSHISDNGSQVTISEPATVTGPIVVPYLNTIPMADQFTGADMCAKVRAAAIYALANHIGQVDATHFSGTQACATDMLANLCAAGTENCGLVVNLGVVHVQSTVPQTITNSGIVLHGMGPLATQLEYTGATAVPAVLTISDTTNSVVNDQVTGIFIYGDTGNATDGLLLIAARHSQFRDVYTWGVTGCGIDERDGVTNTFDSPRTSKWDAIVLGIDSHSTPTSGLCFDQNTSGSQTGPSSDDTILNAAAEFVTGSGWHVIDAMNESFDGGTSESNSRGLQIDSGCSTTTVTGADFETNTANDVLDNGEFSTFIDDQMTSTIATALELGASSQWAFVGGGFIHAATYDTGSSGFDSCISGDCNLAGITSPGYINTTAGFTINGAAPAGYALVGNGTGYVNSTLPYVGTKTYAGTGTPTDTCSATSFTGAIEVNATPTAYQCSNATGSYAWNVLGGGAISNSTFTVGTSAIAANTCTTAATVTMPGVKTTSVFSVNGSTDITAVTGWGPFGGLVLRYWPTTDTFNYRVCNQSGASIAPSASVTFNVGAQ